MQNANLNLFTIGFTQKRAEYFFEIISSRKIKCLIDVRLNNQSQLAGYTKKQDIPFFLKTICSCSYKHKPEWAPTKIILNDYKAKKISWHEYSEQFKNLLAERNIENKVNEVDLNYSCLLCSEPKPDKCHRRLVAEYLSEKIVNIKVIHL